MALDITGIVGADNMNLAAKDTVIKLLQEMPQPATTKRYLMIRWARLVGFYPTNAELDEVAPSAQ